MNGGPYGLGRASTSRPFSPAAFVDEAPGDGLVAIEAGEHREVGLKALDVEGDADVAREQSR